MPVFSQKNIEIFLQSITSSRSELQLLLRDRIIELDEWFQPVIFYKTPCILHENLIVPIGRPTLRRYFENLIGDWLEEENGQCLRDYDALISDYVKFGLERCNAKFLEEDAIKKLTNTNKRICDFLIDEEQGYILLEVKNKSLIKKIPTSSHPIPLKTRLKTSVVSAKEQLDDTREACEKLLQFNGRFCHRVIITKSYLLLGDIKSLLTDYDEPIPIWIMSLADVDHLVELVRRKRTTFCEFFQDLNEKQGNPEHSVFTVSMLFKNEPYRLDELPQHLMEVTDKAFDPLIRRFKDDNIRNK